MGTPPWTIQTLLQWGTEFFTQKGFEVPRLEAEHLLCHALGVNRLHLFTHFDQRLTAAELKQYRGYIERRLTREPLAYITGVAAFMSLPFQVTPAVLIPRPETERLVEIAIDFVKQQQAEHPAHENHAIPFTIADVGTGSGCIAVSLAKYLCGPAGSDQRVSRAIQITATDGSPAALAVAKQNAAAHQVDERITFVQGDILSPFSPASCHLIVSNPPYIDEAGRVPVDPEIRYEPREALYAEEAGLAFIYHLLAQSVHTLAPNGSLLMEIGLGQQDAVQQKVASLPLVLETVYPDLKGIDRVVHVRKPAR